MYQFIESICIRDQEPMLLDYHQKRLDRTFASYYPPVKPHSIEKELNKCAIPSGLIKARLLYDSNEIHMEFESYMPPKIDSLKVIESKIDYGFKFFDRTELSLLHAERKECDDILIVKNGWVTDSYFANCAFFKNGMWHTPDTFLLNGVKRNYLIDQGLIQPSPISVNEISKFEKVSLINAMLDLGQVEIFIENIHE